MSSQKEKLLHARIRSPLLIRKTLLESAITSAEMLKSLHEIKKIRAEKNKKKSEIKKLMLEISELRLRLMEHELPAFNTVQHEKIQKVVPKKRLVHEEAKKRKQQEKLLEKEAYIEKTGLDLEIEKLRDRINKL